METILESQYAALLKESARTRHDSGFSHRLAIAAAQWESIIGRDGIVYESQAAYSPCTTGVKRTIPLALIPSRASQIPALMQTARAYGIAVYPISTGRNWGYGSANPVADGNVVLDLSRLNRISNLDVETGTVCIEPGVTQASLHEFLTESGADLMVPTTGGGPQCSVLGNLLERGFGLTPYCDHFQALIALEAVLPSGEVYRSPLNALGSHASGGVHKWGVGPYLDGIFSQSNFGIVTSATIALAHRPESVAAIAFSCDEDELPSLVDVVGGVMRKLGGVLGGINLMNARRRRAMSKSSRHTLRGDQQSEPADDGIAAWTGLAGIYAPKRVLKACKKEIAALLSGRCRQIRFFSRSSADRLLRAAAWIPGRIGKRLAIMAEGASEAMKILEGTPSEYALRLCFPTEIRFPDSGAPVDPARQGCGMMWYCPLIPLRSGDAAAFVAMAERVCAKHGIPPLITLTAFSPRSFEATMPILFDRADRQATERARACYRELVEAGMEHGWCPYRIGVDYMNEFLARERSGFDLAALLKQAIDPDHILAPGRYCRTDAVS